jgi:hypothetical protein
MRLDVGEHFLVAFEAHFVPSSMTKSTRVQDRGRR